MKQNKNKDLEKTNEQITGQIIVNNKQLTLDKDFKVTPDGLELTESGEKKLFDKDTYQYSMFYSKRITKKNK